MVLVIYQHMLMARITVDFDQFLKSNIICRAVERLVDLQAEERGLPPPQGRTKERLLAKIQMAANLRRALDEHIHDLIVYGNDSREALLIEVLSATPHTRPTWKEIGAALGTSAQAAHRKYGKTLDEPGAIDASDH